MWASCSHKYLQTVIKRSPNMNPQKKTHLPNFELHYRLWPRLRKFTEVKLMCEGIVVELSWHNYRMEKNIIGLPNRPDGVNLFLFTYPHVCTEMHIAHIKNKYVHPVCSTLTVLRFGAGSLPSSSSAPAAGVQQWRTLALFGAFTTAEMRFCVFVCMYVSIFVAILEQEVCSNWGYSLSLKKNGNLGQCVWPLKRPDSLIVIPKRKSPSQFDDNLRRRCNEETFSFISQRCIFTAEATDCGRIMWVVKINAVVTGCTNRRPTQP